MLSISVLHSWIWNEQFHLYLGLSRLFGYCCHPLSEAFPLYWGGDIRYSKYSAVCWQGGATFSAGAERFSALTITWLKVTENNNDWDEAEPITFSGEPVKTALPIPFTKELSSCQMMHVTGFHFPFFVPDAALQSCFCIWKPTYYNLWTLEEFFFLLLAMTLTASSTLGRCSILSGREIHEKYSVKSASATHGSHRNLCCIQRAL